MGAVDPIVLTEAHRPSPCSARVDGAVSCGAVTRYEQSGEPRCALHQRRWVACSEVEFGPVGAVRHIGLRKTSTVACGATANQPSIWRGNTTKPTCAPCVDAVRSRS